MRNKIITIVLLALIGGGGYYAWMKSHAVPIESQYKMAQIETGDVTQTVAANGTLNPVILVNVGTPVSGMVKKLYVDFNDQVKAGQILAELDPALFRAQVGQSEANVASAKASLDLALANEKRTEALFKQEYVAKQDLDTAVQAKKSAQAQLELARAQLERDRTNLNYSVIRSPVSGVVVDRQIDVGQTVAASFQTPTLFRIAQDLRNMQIDSSFAEADIGNIKVGQLVRFTVDAFPNRTFVGHVQQVRLNATVQQNVVTYDVVVSVDNPEEILKPGMTAYVNVVVAQKDNVVLIRNAALRFKPAKAEEKKEKGKTAAQSVYVIRDGKLQAVSVKTGISDGKFSELLEGDLKSGDKVVVEEIVPSGEGQQSTLRMRVL